MSRKVGLSEFTSQRLAELKARRAEAELSDSSNASLLPSSGLSDTAPAPAISSIPTPVTITAPVIAPKPSVSINTNRDAYNYKSPMISRKEDSNDSVGSDKASFSISTAPSTVEPTTRPPMMASKVKVPEHDHNKYNNNEEEDAENLGFACLPDQIHRKAIKKGFDFTIMVVGQSGLGKSTLITSMFFNKDLYKDREVSFVEDLIEKTVSIEKRYMEIEEYNVKLRLTIIDTPGYSDALDCTNCWRPIEDYILRQFDQYYRDESGLNRRNIQDNRVHCCLYFVSPTGRGLQQMDVQFMLKLHNKVNIVPIIAKADTLGTNELKALKAKILEDIDRHGIKVYEIPHCESDEDEDVKTRDEELRNLLPFAVVGGNGVVEVNGRKVKGRIYPWGVVEVENPKHSDFTKLRQFLVSTHMQDLKDVTREIHYENFRANKIKEDGVHPSSSDADLLLRQKEEEIQKMQEMLRMMQSQLVNNSKNRVDHQMDRLL